MKRIEIAYDIEIQQVHRKINHQQYPALIREDEIENFL